MDQPINHSARDPHDERPDPDAILAGMGHEDRPSPKGRLKIFFGYSAGVGKTYAMLSAARALEMKRGDVLVGYVEPHGRPETEALLLGLDILPYKTVSYRGIALREFDLDAALARKPKLLLVDELAHTNAEGCRHAKRWQDIVELLDAGIDVYTTVNVQHIESLNDVVGKITGIAVRETVPDSVFDRASDIELVDLPPHELLERFAEGKVYVPDQARRAANRFFRREILVALRELALRKTAEVVNRQVEAGRRGLPTKPIWATRDRLMVAVGPSPTSARLIRSTRRMATELRAPWIAVAVERPSAGTMSEATRANLDANLRLAESLGAETVSVQRESVADAIVDVAKDRGVTRLVVGKTAEPRWKQLLGLSIVDRVVRRSGDIDVLVIRGEPEATPPRPEPAPGERFLATKRDEFFSHMLMLSPVLVATIVIGLGLRAIDVSEPNIIMVFLLGVVVIAYLAGRVAAAVLAVACVLAFNFFFTEPRFTFVVNDLEYLVTFSIMLLVGLVVSGLVGRVRMQAKAAEGRADANEILHRVASRLASTTGRAQISIELLGLLDDLMHLDAAIFFRDSGGLGPGMGDSSLIASHNERAVAAWTMEHGAEAGLGTNTLPNSQAWYIPLSPREGETIGVLGLRPKQADFDFDLRRLMTSIAVIAAQAAEREDLSERARTASVSAESERLRSDLLSTVSHDLRTPLATIGGAASAVLEHATSRLDEQDKLLLTDIEDEAVRMTRLIENLLQLGKLDDGRATVNADWYPIDEVVDAGLKQVGRAGSTEFVRVDLPGTGLFVYADPTLLTQLLFNLLDNAQHHARDSEIVLRAGEVGRSVRIEVLDRGPGLGDDPSRLLSRFERGAAKSTRGLGLGLTICKAIAEAHGGSLEARNRSGGGAEFVLTLPYPKDSDPPTGEAESESPETD